ncbi:MAG: FkbM family methyltransferase [Selenomonadaceae bacterium]|nr:FkbM family methyltransferase [Selenomonadaceae bacterium]
MKDFIKLIERAHKERFKFIADKLIDEKIPVAFLSVEPFEKAVEQMHEYLFQSNVTNLITATPPPHVSSEFQIDCAVTDLKDVSKIHPRPEYILTLNSLSARVAAKYLPNCKTLVLCSRAYAENIYETFMNNLTELQKVYESFIDEESRDAFCGYWLGNLTRQWGKFSYSNDSHYFTCGFIPEKDSIVIDGGVLDGTTSALFCGLGCNVYGFEMDKINFEASKTLAKEKGFVLENLGLGAYNHEMNYVHAPTGNPGASKLDNEGSETAKIVSLDWYVREKGLPRVDCIKLDVEGAELDVLRGARTTLARWKPILILSAYHKADDFWTLMNFVKSVRPDYEWSCRHYSMFPEDDIRWLANGSYLVKILHSLDMEVRIDPFNECCLLAR